MPVSFKTFEGLYGDNRQLLTDGLIHHEWLEVRSRLHDWIIGEHLHTDLVQVFFFTSGNGVLLADQQRVGLHPPCVLLIPANTLHGFDFEPDMVGEVFTLPEQVLETLFKASPHVLLEVNRLHQFTFAEGAEAFVALASIKEKICRELSRGNLERAVTLQLLIHLLWIYLYRISLEADRQVYPSDNRTLQYFHSFQKLIRKSIHEVKSVKEYAQELNITTVHLNRICQALVKKSALAVIHGYLITEAKKYLLHTSQSLSEITYSLNLKDPAYFSRFFRKQTGLSPRAYRKKAQEETRRT